MELLTRFFIISCYLILTGVCVQIHDGDTISLRTNEGITRVRVASIDCPELAQPYGKAAWLLAYNLCYQQELTLEPLEIDNYNRLVARVYLPDGRNFAQEMVEQGYAWYFGRYHEDRQLRQLHRQARNQKRGLWQDARPMPPWQWRRLYPRD